MSSEERSVWGVGKGHKHIPRGERGVRSMDNFKAWYKNRWDCINNGIDIPLLDFCFCVGSLPILALICILLCVSCPIWGIPFIVYKILREE